MPVMDGLEATAQILADRDAATARVLILTTFDLDEYVYGALQAGASGFLLKDTPPADLLAGIRVVAAGDALLSPRVTRHLIEDFVRRPPARPPPRRARRAHRARERGAGLVARGCRTPRSPTSSYVSPATAKTHVSRLLMKLGRRDRAQLVVSPTRPDWSAHATGPSDRPTEDNHPNGQSQREYRLVGLPPGSGLPRPTGPQAGCSCLPARIIRGGHVPSVRSMAG